MPAPMNKCAICEVTSPGVYRFQSLMRSLGYKSDFAHPRCLSKKQDERDKAAALRGHGKSEPWDGGQ